MKMVKLMLLGAVAAGLSGCATMSGQTYAQAEVTRAQSEFTLLAAQSPFRVSEVRVEVPRSLTTTETDEIKPRVDIVWHGDAYGDRYAQVDEIMTAALEMGVSGFSGARDVVLDVTMERFHGVTPRTRARNPYGAHEIAFSYVLRDAGSGEVLVPATKVNKSFAAYYGVQAMEAVSQGLTQKVRVTNFVADVIAAELSGTL